MRRGEWEGRDRGGEDRGEEGREGEGTNPPLQILDPPLVWVINVNCPLFQYCYQLFTGRLLYRAPMVSEIGLLVTKCVEIHSHAPSRLSLII